MKLSKRRLMRASRAARSAGETIESGGAVSMMGGWVLAPSTRPCGEGILFETASGLAVASSRGGADGGEGALLCKVVGSEEVAACGCISGDVAAAAVWEGGCVF